MTLRELAEEREAFEHTGSIACARHEVEAVRSQPDRLLAFVEEIASQFGNDSRELCGYYRRRAGEVLDAVNEPFGEEVPS